jgi:hypothetical protein
MNRQKTVFIILLVLLVGGAGLYLMGSDPSVAKVVQIRGKAQRLGTTDSEPQPLSTGDSLAMGEGVETGPDSGLTLEFVDQSKAILAENTRVTLLALHRGRMGKQADTLLQLEQGNIESRVNKQSGFQARYEVVTPALQLAVRGTVFMVTVDKQTGKTRSMVLEGEIQAGQKANPQQQVAVLAGYGTVTEVGQQIGSPRELLPAPKVDRLQPLIERLPLKLSWAAVDNAKGYRLQLMAGPDHSHLIHDATYPGPGALVEELPDTEYSVKVRAVDEAGLEGMNGEQPFTLNAHPFPPEPLAPLNDTRLVGTKKIKFRWKKSSEARTYKIEIARSADFANIISHVDKLPAVMRKLSLKLDPGTYYWRGASENAQEGWGPYSDVHQFTVEAPQQPVVRPKATTGKAGPG